MRRRHTKTVLGLFVVCLFIGTSIIPAFSYDATKIDYQKELNYTDHNEMDKVLSSRISRFKEHIQTKECPFEYYRSGPTTIDRINGEWDMVVPDEYSSIQEAIDNTSFENGYRIFVRNGIYFENIVIKNERIILHGESKENTIIDGNNNENTLKIDSNYINISGFTIRNGNVGINIFQSSGIFLFDNIIHQNRVGIKINNQSHANNITTNKIMDNTLDGILLNKNCIGNTIVANVISNNAHFGLWISEVCKSNIVISNEIHNNQIGINVSYLSNGNYLLSNNLISNNLNAWDDSENNWDNGNMGNYWDDYIGIDNDGDGIGDTPYRINGGDNQDNYPLIIQPLEIQFFDIDKIINNSKPMESTKTSFNFNGKQIYVPDDYPSIQEAINNSSDGDIVHIRSGVYYENVIVNKQIKIMGEGSNNTIVDGERKDSHVFKLNANNIQLSDITIRNCSCGSAGIKICSDSCNIHGINITDCGAGVEIWEKDFNNIENNTFFKNFYGIYIHQSDNYNIKNNVMMNNKIGLVSFASSGQIFNNLYINIHFEAMLCINAYNSFFAENNMSLNNFYFIDIINLYLNNFGIQMFSSNNNIIQNNKIDYFRGIAIHKSSNNILKNNIVGGRFSCISLWYKSEGNSIEKNIIKSISCIWYEMKQTLFSEQGILLYSSNNNLISENNIINATELLAIGLGYSNNNTILSNKISKNPGGAIALYMSDENNIVLNELKWNDEGGIELDSSNRNFVENNYILDGGPVSLWISNFNYIHRNWIKNNQIGMALGFRCQYNNISDNLLSLNRNCGISMAYSSNNIFLRNSFKGNGYYLKHNFKFPFPFSPQIVSIYCFSNKWDCNYWDNWIGFGPKILFGFPLQVDWHPAREPYDFGR